jgi:FlaA1/EpsC-like NDP-sugar epimerase
MRLMLSYLFRLPRKYKRAIQLLTDVILLSSSLLVAVMVKQDSWLLYFDPAVWQVLLITLPLSLLLFIRLGFYRAVIRYLSPRALKTILAGVASSALIMGITGYLTGLTAPFTLSLIYGMLALLSVGGIRFFLRSLYQRSLMRDKTRVVIYGAGACGSRLIASLRQSCEFAPIAFVDDWRGMQGTYFEGLKVHAPDELPRLIVDYGAQRILLAIPSTTHTRRREILRSLEPLGLPVQIVPSMDDVVNGRARLNDIRDVSLEDLLGRDPVPPCPELLNANIRDKVVLVTGAGGSIGSELCRQILALQPRQLLLMDACEHSLYRIEQELLQLAQTEGAATEGAAPPIKPLLGSVQQQSRLESLLRTFGVQTIYHAAAYKHVPLVEYNILEGVRNNVFGTLATAQAAIAARVETFVLVSTDKAVRPTNVMGTTKRLAELICQALAHYQSATRFCMVRFGNVLGSSGSVVPLFRRQIASGGPLTVTHPDITRYFMTIPEAAQLVLQAGAMGQGGDVFVLDMGKPVRVAELAREMVRLSGLSVRDEHNPDGEIEIRYTGLRPGEKLYEELLVGENVASTQHPRIRSAREIFWEWPRLEPLLTLLHFATDKGDIETVLQLMLDAPAAYHPRGPVVDLVWNEHGKRPAKVVLAPDRAPARQPDLEPDLEPQLGGRVDDLLKAAAMSLFKGPHH